MNQTSVSSPTNKIQCHKNRILAYAPLLTAVATAMILTSCSSRVPFSCGKIDYFNRNSWAEKDITITAEDGSSVHISSLSITRGKGWESREAFKRGDEPTISSCDIHAKASSDDFAGKIGMRPDFYKPDLYRRSPATDALRAYLLSVLVAEKDCRIGRVFAEMNGVFYQNKESIKSIPDWGLTILNEHWTKMPIRSCLYWTQA